MRLETIDVKKNSSSVTLVKQKLWVSEAVPGYAQYRAFHEKLAKRLGFDAVRLGGLSGMLRYWDGSLDPVRKSIKDVKGYPVKSTLSVEGRYTAGVGTASAKTSSVQSHGRVFGTPGGFDGQTGQTPFPGAVRFWHNGCGVGHLHGWFTQEWLG